MSRQAVRLLVVTSVLVAFGILMIFSASAIVAGESRRFNDPYFFLKKQLVWCAISFVGFLIAMKIDYRFWMKHSKWVLLGVVALLVAVMVPGIGSVINGARRWIRMGSIGIQPSEMAKLALLIFAAAFIARNPERIKNWWKGVVPLMATLAGVVGLILIEPDFGTSVFIIGVIGMVVVIGGMRTRHAIGVGVLVVALGALLLMFSPDYVWHRIQAFMSPEDHTHGKGYHVTQSLIALGSGGWTGVGLGESTQKLFFLPEVQGDFIFAIVGEEIGLLGTVGVIGLFIFFLATGWKIARGAADLFGFLMAAGITMFITLQAVLNMAVVTASMPAKGMPLPFVSFGGSSLFFLMFAIGILVSIANRSPSTCPPEADSLRAALSGAPSSVS